MNIFVNGKTKATNQRSVHMSQGSLVIWSDSKTVSMPTETGNAIISINSAQSSSNITTVTSMHIGRYECWQRPSQPRYDLAQFTIECRACRHTESIKSRFPAAMHAAFDRFSNRRQGKWMHQNWATNGDVHVHTIWCRVVLARKSGWRWGQCPGIELRAQNIICMHAKEQQYLRVSKQ